MAKKKGSIAKKNRKAAKTDDKPGRADVAEPDICFIIMPFGGWLDDYYDAIYMPAVQKAGLKPHRADDLYRPSTIVNDIWSYTRRAKLLLADLTGKNPNVFYELGLAHALAKPVILVAESMEDIPFDLRALRIIVYDKNDPHWGDLLQEKVEASVREVIQAPQEAVLPAFLQLRESTGAVKVTSQEKDLIEIKQELDLLKREVRNRAIVRDRPLKDPSRLVDIGPTEAARMVRDLVRLGVPDSQIVDQLERLGPPENWIEREILQAKQTVRRRDLRKKPAVAAPDRRKPPVVPPEPASSPTDEKKPGV